MAIREATDRVRKSTNEMKSAMRGKCKTPGCSSHLTLWKGPGEKEYCDPCQRNFATFGGMATPAKAYSQMRQTSCSDCGFEPDNLVTLCSNCHNIKTIEYGDNITPSNQNIL